ncbi:MAG: LacI family DNA-binding transcriptional regulator, partial [Kiritimatiellae bacterium]|nr:LacI family DNA-binding transcriptional regulator [Kiritimatiellia bacterium]
MREIAARLGVSGSTVYLALRNGPRSRFVSEATRKRVRVA